MLFVKDHEELYGKTNSHFKEKAKKECLWKRLDKIGKLSLKVCRTKFESKRTCYRKLTQSKYSQASKGKTERQNWIQNKFYFLKTHIRFKRIIRLQVPSLMNASAASLHDISIALTDMDSMEISMRSNTTIQPPVTSPSAVSGQPADHGPVCTDENHTAIIHWANVGDNKNSLL